MRCFFWENGVTRPGVQIHERGKHKAVSLGLDLETLSPRFLCLHRANTPDIRLEGSREYIDDAYPVSMRVPSGDGRFFVLAKPHDKHATDDRVLVHVSTFAPNRQAPPTGKWRPIHGDIETIASGKLSGRQGAQWLTGLVRLSVGSALRVSTENPDEDDYILELTENGIRTSRWTEFAVRQVLAKEGVLEGGSA